MDDRSEFLQRKLMQEVKMRKVRETRNRLSLTLPKTSLWLVFKMTSEMMSVRFKTWMTWMNQQSELPANSKAVSNQQPKKPENWRVMGNSRVGP